MPTPIILLGGEAGSGKDTVADILCRDYGAMKLAQADPLKRFVQYYVGFTDEQLWGPSGARNAPDPRGEGLAVAAADHIIDCVCRDEEDFVENWLKGLDFPDYQQAQENIIYWAKAMRRRESCVPRVWLQTLGSWGRELDPDVWINKALNDAQRLLSGYYDYQPKYGLNASDKSEDYKIPNLVVITDGRYANEIVAARMRGCESWRIVRPNNELGKQALAAGVPNHSSETEFSKIPCHFFTRLLYNDKDLSWVSIMVNALMMDFYRTP